jgi:hypothetical protein
MRHPGKSRRAAMGMSLVETALALGITGLAMGSMIQISSDAQDQVKDAAIASQVAQVYAAGTSYLQANYANLLAATGGGIVSIPVARTSVTGAVPAQYSAGLPSLQGGGFLPASFIGVNGSGQQIAMLFRRDPSNPAMVDGLVETTGGHATTDVNLGRIAAKIGAAGGAYMQQPPPTAGGLPIRGVGGGWAEIPANWSAGTQTPASGHVMAYLSSVQNTNISDYLYRYNVGVPEANTMHADVNMDGMAANTGQSIQNAKSVNTQNIGPTPVNPTVTVGGTNQGQINVNGYAAIQGGGVACSGATPPSGCGWGISQRAGGFADNSDGWATFTGTTNAAGGILVQATPGHPGDNLAVAGAGAFTGNLATSGNMAAVGAVSSSGLYDSGSATVSGDAGIGGNLTVGGTIAGGSLGISGGATINGNLGVAGGVWSSYLGVAGNANVSGNLTVGQGVYANYLVSYGDLQVNGNSTTNGSTVVGKNITAGGTVTGQLTTNATASSGDGCTNGQIAINSGDGSALFCQNSHYAAMGGGGASFFMTGIIAVANPLTGRYSCPSSQPVERYVMSPWYGTNGFSTLYVCTAS